MNAFIVGAGLPAIGIDAVLDGGATAAIAGKPAPTGSVDAGGMRDERIHCGSWLASDWDRCGFGW
ncbi:hypothetical protein [Pseudomonas jessenii]|uniref:hypothetical protein n=1 Tax=Pseudomonas jessenii TaxID=77298 RepID=UPI0011C06C69|nr:hypothetical protein [Pseudomonas jessenii]